MKNDITEDDLRKAIADAMGKSSPGFAHGETTAPAEARKHGITVFKARQILNYLSEEGFLEKAKIVYTDDWGDAVRVKGYKIKGE